MNGTTFPMILTITTTLLSLLMAASTACGATAGVGIQLISQDGSVTILEVFEGSPAKRADLQRGDRIVKINGAAMHGVAVADAVQRVAGPAGEKVTLSILRQAGDIRQEFDVTLTREVVRPPVLPARVPGEFLEIARTPTGPSRKVEWHGDRIVSRILPYPDLLSLLLRLPIAHAKATGQGVQVAVIQRSPADGVVSAIRQIAPGAAVSGYVFADDQRNSEQLTAKVKVAGTRVAVVPDVDAWPREVIVPMARALLSDRLTLIIPADLSEDPNKIETVNMLHTMGVLTVGCVSSQCLVVETSTYGTRPYNQHIRRIAVDVFSTVVSEPYPDRRTPVVSAAGVAALVLERWPDLPGPEVRRRIIESARAVWQGTSVETGQWIDAAVDPITTEYKPAEEAAVFRFRVLDAAAALDVDTEVPWFLNMLNCPKAWEITKGKGAVVAITDNGFHIRHPDLAEHIKTTMSFGPRTLDMPDQHFHGTEMSRLVLAVAPEASIIPLLCQPEDIEAVAPNVTRSFEFAVAQKADVISSSWSARLNTKAELLAAIRKAVDQGAVVSWFHYPEPYPGILRPYFTYGSWSKQRRLGFSDRFLINPPLFHPVEIEAGLSNTAPQAAGIAALVRSVNPALTPAQIERLIIENSDPVGEAILIPDVFRIVQASRGR